MKKISVVVFSYYLEDTRVRKQCELLARNEYDVSVFCLKRKAEPTHETHEGVKIVRTGRERKTSSRSKFNYVSDYLHFFFCAFYLLSMKNLKTKDSAVFVHNMPNFLVFSALIPKLRRVPIILDTHDLMPELWSAMEGKKSFLTKLLLVEEKLSHKFATKLMTVNRTIAQYLSQRNNKEYEVFHNGPLSFGFNNNADLDGFSLVYHGNIHERYGLQYLIEILPKLKKRYPELTLDVHGYGPYAEAIQKQIEDLSIETYCKMHGRFNPEDVNSILKGKTIGYAMIDKCQQNDLAIPVKVLEYISNGLPCVSSNLVTMKEYFSEDSVTYVEHQHDLFNAYVNLLDNREVMTQQIKLAQQNMKAICWSKESKSFLKFLNGIVS